MIRSPAGPGTTGPPWWRSRELVMSARPLSRATSAAAAAHAGLEMLKRFNIKYTNEKKYYNAGLASRVLCWRAQAQISRSAQALNSQAYKLSSTETQEESPQAKGSSFRRPESASSGTWDPEYKRTSWSRAQATRIKVFFLCFMWKDIWCGENRTKLTFFNVVTFNSTVKKVPKEE